MKGNGEGQISICVAGHYGIIHNWNETVNLIKSLIAEGSQERGMFVLPRMYVSVHCKCGEMCPYIVSVDKCVHT